MKSQFRIPISIKLVLVTVLIILAIVVPLAYDNSTQFEEEFGKSQDGANTELANSKASEVEGLFLNAVEKVRTVTNLMLQEFGDEDQRRRAMDLVFYRDLDFVNIEIYELKDNRLSLYKRETNETYLKMYGLDRSYMQRLRQEKPFPILAIFSDGERIQIQNSTLKSGAPLFTIGVPFPDDLGVVRHAAVVDIRLDRLQRAFSIPGARTLYLVDSHGSILAHAQDRLAMEGASFFHIPIVQEALSKSNLSTKGSRRFQDVSTGGWMMGAYSRTAFGPTVIAQAPEETVLEPARMLITRSITIAGYVLSAALFFVIVFSITLTNPIEVLHEATMMVGQGNFDVQARVRTRDEVGDLARSFNNMVEGLKERDKIKNIFNKFHGSSVTEDLLKKGDVDLGGTRKTVTILFSDIRDFTKFSEGHTPEEVVDMLNEYFQIMVGIITSNNGIVDKFVGDAIMAVWGAPNSTGYDREYALKACLEMRSALDELNERRLARGQTAIKIGIGLHTGPAISGTIGSHERMEYTVIGDSVNMASRIEASTKAFGSDLLVSNTVADGLDSRFIFELAGSAEVKGKSEPIQMYKVRGYIADNGERIFVETAYSNFEAEQADKVKLAG